MANDEVMVLYVGENVLRHLLEVNAIDVTAHDEKVLLELLAELKRIRFMRVARQEARKRATQKKRAALLRDAQRGDRRVRELLERSTQRDHANGLGPN